MFIHTPVYVWYITTTLECVERVPNKALGTVLYTSHDEMVVNRPLDGAQLRCTNKKSDTFRHDPAKNVCCLSFLIHHSRLECLPRYDICGRPLRGLIPFFRKALGVSVPAKITSGRSMRARTPVPPLMPPSRLLESRDSALGSTDENAYKPFVPTATVEVVKGTREASASNIGEAKGHVVESVERTSHDEKGSGVRSGTGPESHGERFKTGRSRERTLLVSMRDALGSSFNPETQARVFAPANVVSQWSCFPFPIPILCLRHGRKVS